MIDSVQLVLLIVIVILTVLLVVLGVQVFFILKDIRRVLAKANKVIDNANSITSNISGPVASFTTLVSGLKAGSLLTAAKFIRALLSKEKDDEQERKRE